MGKEVEKLILENNELLATKNALNIVKDDLIVKVDELSGEIEIMREELMAANMHREKLRIKLSELEDEVKRTKEAAKQQTNPDQPEDEAEVPMAQRKRFTRVEMARVLMERNQYKERFMELQEAVRWTEMIRATRTVETLDKKSKHKFWNFFGNLFSSSANEPSGPLLRYNNANNPEGPAGPPTNDGQRNVGIASLAGQSANTGNNPPTHGTRALMLKDYAVEGPASVQRKSEHYKQVRAHVQKEDGRLHAYGWSLPGTKGGSGGGSAGALIGLGQIATKHNRGVKVPVPVYCQPLAEANPHMKVFCASGVNLNGGVTRDGTPVFYLPNVANSSTGSKIVEMATTTATEDSSSGTSGGELNSLDKQLALALESSDPDSVLSSYVWICTSTHSASTVTVMDANDAAVVLDSFPVCQTHLLCICTVPGALEKDYAMSENSEVTRFGESLEKPGEGEEQIGAIEFVRMGRGGLVTNNTTVDEGAGGDGGAEGAEEAAEEEEEGVRTTGGNLAFSKPVNPITGSLDPLAEPPLNSIAPTMWMGAQNGMLYVHSAVSRWRMCLGSVCLPDAILSMVHVESRVVAALANGKLAVFRRGTDGQWDLGSYHLVTLGSPKHSVRCLCVVKERIWAAHRNKIFVVDPISLNIVHVLPAHPRNESQVSGRGNFWGNLAKCQSFVLWEL